MPVAYPTLLTRQLTCRRTHEQRGVVSRIINPHDIEPDSGELLIVQHMPPPQPYEPSLPREVALHVWCDFWHVAPGMEHRTVQGAPPRFACGWGWSTPQLDVAPQTPQQGVLLGRCRKLLLGGNAGIHDQKPGPRGGGQSIEHARHRVLAAGTKPDAAHQSHTHPLNHHDRGQGGHDISPHSPASSMAVAFAR